MKATTAERLREPFHSFRRRRLILRLPACGVIPQIGDVKRPFLNSRCGVPVIDPHSSRMRRNGGDVAWDLTEMRQSNIGLDCHKLTSPQRFVRQTFSGTVRERRLMAMNIINEGHSVRSHANKELLPAI